MNCLYFKENRKDAQSLTVKMGYMLQKEERRMGGDKSESGSEDVYKRQDNI